MAVQPKRRPERTCFSDGCCSPRPAIQPSFHVKPVGGLVWKEPGCNVSNPELRRSLQRVVSGELTVSFVLFFFIFGLPPGCDPGKRIWRKMERKRMAQLTIRHLKKVAIQSGALRISSYAPGLVDQGPR